MSEVAQRWPAEYTRWRAGDPSPGCRIEHHEELGKRAAAALRDIADRFPDGTVVVATHGGAAREGCAGFLGWPAEVTRTLGGLSNCRWTELRFDTVRGWQLRAHNLG
jgi:probable phosphoglycerate mutase